MKKKFLAVAMAAVMAFSVVPTLPAATTVAEAAESTVINIDKQIGESDLSAAWWTAFSDHYKIEDGKSYTFNFDVYGGSAAYNNFCMIFTNEAATAEDEQSSDYKEFAVVRNDSFGWGGGNNKSLNGDDIVYAGTLSEGATIVDVMEAASVSLTISRNGKEITTSAEFVSKTDASMTYDYSTACTAAYADGTAATDVYFTLVADGSFMTPSGTTVEIATPTEAPNTGSENPTTDFSQVETQPVVKYTFDDDSNITLAGEANIADGILNLASDSSSSGTTYAQLPDLTGYDFSNGVTLTADINVADYSSDWTPIFMIGDGTIGGEGADATALYHLTQGFSSEGGLNGNYFEGYFGNGISSPYTWDYFNNEDNRGKWYTLSVTITPTTMTTYINGQQVQTEDGDFTNDLAAFAVAKNNYLGTSYWADDPDFAGSMDNVGIYNVALSADDMSKLSTAEKVDIGAPGTSGTSDKTNGTKKIIIMSGVSAKLGTKKVTGKINAPEATVTVQVNKAAAVKATVADKKFTATLKSKLKIGDKVKITVTADGYSDYTKTVTVKGTMTVKVTAKKGAKKVTGTVSVKKATVKVKVGKKAYKKAKVSGKKFTLKVAKLKKGTKVTVKATKKNYKTATKSVKVK